MRNSLAVVGAAFALAGCEPKVVELGLKIVTSSCQAPTPLENATHLRLRITGAGIDPPMDSVSSISSSARELKIPQIPAGAGREIEVRAYAGDPAAGGRVVSIGRSLPFEVPAVVGPSAPPEIAVFLRRVGMFTAPSTQNAPDTCALMQTARAGHTATLLDNGKVFIAGGYQLNGGGRTALFKAEFFNPETGGFEDAPNLGLLNSDNYFTPLARAFHTATLLPSHQVLLWDGEEYAQGDINGSKPSLRASVLLFDVDKNRYGGVPYKNLPNIVRSHHAAALDANGKVLIVGGETRVVNATGTSSMVVADKVEWYDPDTTLGRLVDGVSLPRREMNVVAVQGGKFIAVAGGSDGTALKDEVAFFSYQNGAFAKVQASTTPRLHQARRAAGAANLNGLNDLVLVGGFADPEVLKPIASSEIVATGDSFNVAAGPNLSLARGDICTALLRDGRVLAVGGRTADGQGGAPHSDGSVELIVPQSDGLNAVLGQDALKVSRYHHTCTPLADGSVLVLGGVREQNGLLEVLQDAMIYTPVPLDP